MVIAYYFHQNMIDALTGGREVTRTEEPRLYNLLENLCISRGITMPKLKVMESDALNAFATGMNEKQYSITVTTGLLERLDDAEVEAVLGHELTHIRNGDVRMMVIAVIIAGVISFFAELVFRLWFYSGFSFRGALAATAGAAAPAFAILIAIALIVVAYLLSFVIRLALSRSREFLADAGSVELTKNPDAMISALRKIEGRGELPGATSAVMEMCVDNPREGFGELFDTHPTVDSRVAALVKFAGGHDPGPLALPPQASDADDNRRRTAAAERPWGPAVDEPARLKALLRHAGSIGGTVGPARGSADPAQWIRLSDRIMAPTTTALVAIGVTINHIPLQTRRYAARSQTAQRIWRLPNSSRLCVKFALREDLRDVSTWPQSSVDLLSRTDGA